MQEYQTKFKNKLNIRVDWKAPKLMMKENQETLLIAADRAGLFYGITNMELPEYARSKYLFSKTYTHLYINCKVFNSN